MSRQAPKRLPNGPALDRDEVTTKAAAKSLKTVKAKDEPKKASKADVKIETNPVIKSVPVRKGGGGQPPV